MFFFSPTESQLDLQPPPEVDGSTPEAGAAQTAGGQPCGSRAAAGGQSAGPGELREEETPAADARAQGEGDGERSAEGILRG